MGGWGGGLGNGPSLKMGGGVGWALMELSEWPLTETRGDFGTQTNKETYIFKRVVFRAET